MDLKKPIGYGMLAIYGAASSAALFHYFLQRKEEIENGDLYHALEWREYTVMLDGREKHLTLAGEVHFYNEEEVDEALDLLAKHVKVAHEIGTDTRDELNLASKAFYTVVPGINQLSMFFYCLGSGRKDINAYNLALREGFDILALEEGNERLGDFREQVDFTLKILFGAAIAPSSYLIGLYEKDELEACCKYYDITDRDRSMADSIIRILHEEDDLLAFFGKAHLDPIDSFLRDELDMALIGKSGTK